MAIDQALLKILVCPETKSAVAPAPQDLLSDLNQKIDQKILKTHAGKAVTQKLSAGLLRSDGKRLYPIIDDIPVMLIDEAIDI